MYLSHIIVKYEIEPTSPAFLVAARSTLFKVRTLREEMHAYTAGKLDAAWRAAIQVTPNGMTPVFS